MEATEILERLTGGGRRRQQLTHLEHVPARPAEYGEISLEDRVRAALASRGIERLYIHQAEAIEHVRAGEPVVIVTGTASGKTVCYQVPVLETLLDDPMAGVLCLYPTKALAQDQ